MFHWFGVVTNTKGDSLPNWQVECVQLADGVTVVPIYADENLTPILTASGIADRAKSDSSGNYDFFVPEGTYSLRFYDANGVFQRLQRYLPMYGNAPEAAIAAMEDAQAAQAAAEVAQGLAEDAQAAAEAASELAQTTAGGTVYATWADLAAATGMTAGDSAVVFEDAGTHTDPVVGGTVANAGIYIYSASPAGWERVADTEAVKAADSAVAAEVSADAAALSAATAEAIAGPTYASTAAGLAATTSGQAFAVDAGGGLVSVYLNSSGTAVLQRTLATTGALAASGGSALVGFLQAGTGAVLGTVDEKLKRSPLSPAEFKLVADTDDTNSLKKCFDEALANRRAVRLQGDYVVSGPISTIGTVAAGSVDIELVGNCSITVDSAATAFDQLLFIQTTAINSFSIFGGSLTVELNNKCANGLYIRHLAASRGGVCNITAPITIKNAKNNNAASTSENAGIQIIGDYETIYLNSPRVDGVQRTNASGVCKAISISGFSGNVTIDNPYVANVLTFGAGADADGIATFAKGWATSQVRTEGYVVINGGTFVDCQGRSFKSQCSNVTLMRPTIRRKMVVSITNSHEFDFQAGGGVVIEPDIEYLANGATSPLGTSHSVAAFQHLITDAPSVGRMVGGSIRTNVAIPRICAHITGAAAEAGTTIIDGLSIVPVGAFATTAVTRAIVEFTASHVEACAKKTRIEVNGVKGPIGAYAIGYTSFGGSSLTSKLSWSATNNRNTLGPASASQVCRNLSGSQIGAFEKFMVRNNEGFRDLFTNLTFSVAAMEVGCQFTADLSTCTITNAPGSLGASGYALFECKSAYFGATDRGVLVTKDNASVANTVFWTLNGGTTWGTIK